MKRFLFLSIVLVSAFSLSGCACYGPGFGYVGGCGTTYSDCPGVDYVDGGIGAAEADCGVGCSTGCGGYVGGCGMNACSPCVSCLSCVGEGIRVVGEGALGLAMAPFALVGNLFCGMCNGYESYPNCGCSKEVYYGDNCYQPHDFCDPCACGGVMNNGGCANCQGGHVEGIQAAPSPDISSNRMPQNQVVRNQRTPVYRNGRPVVQASQNGMLRQPGRIQQSGYRYSTVPANVQFPIAGNP